MKYVVIVNGKPESGKTTFEEMCTDYIEDNDYAWCHTISTINPIKEIYYKLGWNGEKTDKARKDLSRLKEMWINNCDGPTKYVVEFVLNLKDDGDSVIFVDIREESEIIKLCEILDSLKIMDIRYSKVLIDRKDNAGIEYGNKSDDMAGTGSYNYTIYNRGTLDDLRKSAHNISKYILQLEE